MPSIGLDFLKKLQKTSHSPADPHTRQTPITTAFGAQLICRHYATESELIRGQYQGERSPVDSVLPTLQPSTFGHPGLRAACFSGAVTP